MSIFHPLINIEIDKSYCIRLNSGKKSQTELNKMLRDLSEDKTNWSAKVLTYINNIIYENNFNIPKDILEVRFNTVKTVNYEFKNKIETLNSNDIIKEMHTILDNNNEQVNDVYLRSNPKYKDGFNDVQMAQIILLLSKISKEASKLWVSINLEIKEIGKVLFYFIPNEGHIGLSKRVKVNDIVIANNYIKLMNDLIDGIRTIPK